MFRRLPITLWLYILGDLWKLVLLTTGVLVTVIAFTAAIKPLADGKLGPEDTLRFMLLAMIPMLQYALPFAACFGATLAYHRLATDNELTAMHAGGVGHRTLLAPAAISGVALAVILLGLSNYIIPRQLRGMSELMAQDAAKWIVNSIQRGESLRPNRNTLLYADRVQRRGPDEVSGAYERLWLGGVLVIHTDDQENIEKQGSARSATIWLRRTTVAQPGVAGSDKPMTRVDIMPTDVVGIGSDFRASSSEFLKPFLVPNAFSDNVKYLSFAELRELRAEPARIDRIDRSKRALAIVLAERRVIDAIGQALRTTGEAHFKDYFGARVTLRAAGLRFTRKEQTPGGASGSRRPGERDPFTYNAEPVKRGQKIVVEVAQDGRTQPLKADAVFLRLPASADSERGAATLTLDLRNVAAEQVGPDGEVAAPDDEPAGARGELAQRPLADLTFEGDEAAGLLARPTAEVERLARERVGAKPSDGAVIDAPLRKLGEEVSDLLREVLSKEQERYAMSVACMVMVLVGSVMAMRLRDALPLTVYLWAFFPALATVLAISAGQQLVHGRGLVGLPVLWAGVGGLSAFALAEYARLRKH
jgi:lipopolysaccharide export LptBFGC system permease protein LptF